MNTAQLSRALTTDHDELKKVSQTMGALECSLGKALQEATDKICETFVLSTKRLVEVNPIGLERPTDVTKGHLLGHQTLAIKRYEFYVNELKSLKETAMSAGFATYWCDPIYLAGYCISPGLVGQPYGECYARPKESMNTGTYFKDGCDIEVLERDGYTSGDKLCVRWELLPPERE
ncbi:hypothetical protein HPB50_017120 [Hyalomma asiaticum]|uniref:Uncharacterized protein n=1 Tax=Hyalomma asiaticum TaxID=266040 RepID=A0ACB7RRI1_HYAAI|nr:hypothetical protein HPB50_017120 [Hyalomma asiaticum]